MKSRLPAVLFCALSGLLAGLGLLASAAEVIAPRWSAPVVLTGAQIPTLKGVLPQDLVAFRYTTGWEQIPVQVDERAVVDFVKIYGTVAVPKRRKANSEKELIHNVRSFKTLVYTDPNTRTGPDPDPTVDADDEIAFMLRDAGNKAPARWRDPDGVVAGSGVEVAIIDPLVAGKPAFVYLFRSAGSLEPSAKKRYVSYEFALKAGAYLSSYNSSAGPNPEKTTITTCCYKQAFSDRWITDVLSILPPLGNGVDILDMQNFGFAPGRNGRTVKSFSLGEGAFIANKSGPVRGIRSFVGANSGSLTQRDYFFYEGREDITTYLRVHPVTAGVSYFEYSPEAKGMRYSNNNNPEGVVLDGIPDNVKAGPLTWEMLQGKQGTFCVLSWLETNIPNLFTTSYYLDDEKSTVLKSASGASAFAASGPWCKDMLPNTDPTKGPAKKHVFHQSLFFEASNVPAGTAARRFEEHEKPLTVQVTRLK